MISWGGIVSVTVRRLTRTIRSSDGISTWSPGPRSSISRPSRNTTPRSYSRRTRIELATAVSADHKDDDDDDDDRGDHGLDQLPLLGRAHAQRQSFEPLDDDRVARRAARHSSNRRRRPATGGRATARRPAATLPSASVQLRTVPIWPMIPSAPVRTRRWRTAPPLRTENSTAARADGRQRAARQQRQQHPGAQAGDRQHRADRHHQHARAPRDPVGGVVRLRDRHHRSDHKQRQPECRHDSMVRRW